jgi:hypothetical protein
MRDGMSFNVEGGKRKRKREKEKEEEEEEEEETAINPTCTVSHTASSIGSRGCCFRDETR